MTRLFKMMSDLRFRHWILNGLAILSVVNTVGCTGNEIVFGILPAPTTTTTDVTTAIALVTPTTEVTAAIGVATIIRWADIATIPGTTVRVIAQRQNALLENNADPINLVGDGTVGSGRDALADGDSDIFNWDITGVRVGEYTIIVIIEAPTGETETVLSQSVEDGGEGAIIITTDLPEPVFTFTAPAADTTVTTGNTFDITWTDNGNANASALMTLGLDTDSDHDSGNEIILLSNNPLSTDGNTGTFTFSFTDEDGNTVPDGTYRVFSITDDGANDPVERNAAGQLLLNP